MEYNFSSDLDAIREITNLTQEELAKELGIRQVTISRGELSVNRPSKELLEKVYCYAFDNRIWLGKIKEMMWHERLEKGHKLLFHGSKSGIAGKLSISKSNVFNDFGQGFYTGESYSQSVSFVSSYDNPSIYLLDFNPGKLKSKKYMVDNEWMLTIAYFRGTLEKYSDHPAIRKLVDGLKDKDYIVAPIADNRMFQIINTFISGEITDEQCKHCLAATNLGYQYVFLNDRALDNLKFVERCYISASERSYYMNLRETDSKLGSDKVKLARIQYRGKGQYIDELLGGLKQ